jgi:hypothetical protein
VSITFEGCVAYGMSGGNECKIGNRLCIQRWCVAVATVVVVRMSGEEV